LFQFYFSYNHGLSALVHML